MKNIFTLNTSKVLMLLIVLISETNKLVSCAGETALEVTNGALSAFENSNTQDANKLAAELATKAFEELMKNIRVR